MMVAIGDSKNRFDIVQLLPKETIYFTFIHPTALILDSNIENLSPTEIQDLLKTSDLGYLNGYDYKDFKFHIKEENNPDFVVKNNKRRYAVAINKDGNEILKTKPSFTLNPPVLVEELKLQIDQKGLVA